MSLEENGDQTPTLHERNYYLFMHFLGHVVQVQTKDGTLYEGLFHSLSSSDSTIFLQGARLKQSKVHHKANTKTKPKEMLKLSPNDYNYIYAPEVSFFSMAEIQRYFSTDAEITTGGLGERELTPWCGAGDDTMALEMMAHDNSERWDQFEINNKLFGVTSTYDENIYTTRLDKSKISPEAQARAAQLAREIEQEQATGNIHMDMERGKNVDMDEEDLHSSVLRPQPHGPSGPLGGFMGQPLEDGDSLEPGDGEAKKYLSSAPPGTTTHRYIPPHKRRQQGQPPGQPVDDKPKKIEADTFIQMHNSSNNPLPASVISAADFEQQLVQQSQAHLETPTPTAPLEPKHVAHKLVPDITALGQEAHTWASETPPSTPGEDEVVDLTGGLLEKVVKELRDNAHVLVYDPVALNQPGQKPPPPPFGGDHGVHPTNRHSNRSPTQTSDSAGYDEDSPTSGQPQVFPNEKQSAEDLKALRGSSSNLRGEKQKIEQAGDIDTTPTGKKMEITEAQFRTWANNKKEEGKGTKDRHPTSRDKQINELKKFAETYAFPKGAKGEQVKPPSIPATRPQGLGNRTKSEQPASATDLKPDSPATTPTDPNMPMMPRAGTRPPQPLQPPQAPSSQQPTPTSRFSPSLDSGGGQRLWSEMVQEDEDEMMDRDSLDDWNDSGPLSLSQQSKTSALNPLAKEWKPPESDHGGAGPTAPHTPSSEPKAGADFTTEWRPLNRNIKPPLHTIAYALQSVMSAADKDWLGTEKHYTHKWVKHNFNDPNNQPVGYAHTLSVKDKNDPSWGDDGGMVTSPVSPVPPPGVMVQQNRDVMVNPHVAYDRPNMHTHQHGMGQGPHPSGGPPPNQPPPHDGQYNVPPGFQPVPVKGNPNAQMNVGMDQQSMYPPYPPNPPSNVYPPIAGGGNMGQTPTHSQQGSVQHYPPNVPPNEQYVNQSQPRHYNNNQGYPPNPNVQNPPVPNSTVAQFASPNAPPPPDHQRYGNQFNQYQHNNPATAQPQPVWQQPQPQQNQMQPHMYQGHSHSYRDPQQPPTPTTPHQHQQQFPPPSQPVPPPHVQHQHHHTHMQHQHHGHGQPHSNMMMKVNQPHAQPKGMGMGQHMVKQGIGSPQSPPGGNPQMHHPLTHTLHNAVDDPNKMTQVPKGMSMGGGGGKQQSLIGPFLSRGDSRGGHNGGGMQRMDDYQGQPPPQQQGYDGMGGPDSMGMEPPKQLFKARQQQPNLPPAGGGKKAGRR